MFLDTYRLEPFIDAMALRDDEVALRDLAAEQGYLYFRTLLDPGAVNAVRHEARRLCAAYGWVRAGSDPVQAQPGAHLAGHGFDDPDWVGLQQALLGQPRVWALATAPGESVTNGSPPAALTALTMPRTNTG